MLVLDVLSLHASGSDREGVLTHKILLSVSFLFCRAKFCLLLPAVSSAPPDFAVLNLLLDGTQSGISLSATVSPFPPIDVLSMTVQCSSLYVSEEHCGGVLLVFSEMGTF